MSVVILARDESALLAGVQTLEGTLARKGWSAPGSPLPPEARLLGAWVGPAAAIVEPNELHGACDAGAGSKGIRFTLVSSISLSGIWAVQRFAAEAGDRLSSEQERRGILTGFLAWTPRLLMLGEPERNKFHPVFSHARGRLESFKEMHRLRSRHSEVVGAGFLYARGKGLLALNSDVTSFNRAGEGD